jgi:DNA repair exonuclease SbcCD nuclease subunit
MERTKESRTPTLILCSDLHLREDTPICRTDDFVKAQWRKLDFISNLQKKYYCSVLCGGDLFDHWKPSPNLLRLAILHLPKQFYTIYGQHDLPQHNLELAHKCGINVLEAGKHLTVLEGVHWGQIPPQKPRLWHTFSMIGKTPRSILVWHKMNWKGHIPWPGCPDPSALRLLKKYPQYDLIVTGDNHQTFTQEYEERWLVNPGSMMRMDADQEEHKPCVFLWYAETNEIKRVYIPIEQGVISREHIELKKNRDNRIDAFVTRLDSEWKAALSFEDNLEIFRKKNKVDPAIMQIIYKNLENEKTKGKNGRQN